MAKDDITDYWHELQLRQSDWAFRAYDRLVGTLSAEVQERLKLRENAAEPYVVIFGKTQVGKTTLLLDLMGIAPQEIPAVSKVLRGGRAAGKSATATAMEYCRSVNDRWGVTLQSQTRWFDTDNLVVQQLGEVREQMESGILTMDAPCVVHIPGRFFAHKGTTTPDIRILDLPGDNPGHEEEQKYVNLMAKTYLPFADLILLVGRGDDLSFLQPDVITLPGIEDWQAMPHRFRIVTTYSYSAQSVKDLMRNDSQYDIGKLRQRLREQIALFGRLSGAASDDNLYFPLEFGISWISMKNNEPDLYARVSPMVASLREELLAQIAVSISARGRLLGTLNTHINVSYIQMNKTEAIRRTIDRFEKDSTRLAQEVSLWDKAIDRVRNKSMSISSLLALNKRESSTKIIEEAAKEPQYNYPCRYPPHEGDRKNDSETLKTMVNDYYRLLSSMHVDVHVESPELATYWGKVGKQLVKPSYQIVELVLDKAFGDIRCKLADYTFDSYFFSSRYCADRKLIRSAGVRAHDCLTQLWKSAWQTALSKVDKEYRQELLSQQTELALLADELEKVYEQKALLSEKIAWHQSELIRVYETSKEDLHRCNQFFHLLNEEYLAALNKQLNGVLQANNDCDALLQIFACAELKNQREELMNLAQMYTG
ncbi:hypothetical protein EF878_18965 [Dickeya undicola]|uniref:Uncharacterized protein n=2 Tax=Dickeya undicola TaxID=1577887 RepID=A0A3N0FRY6_9GAMM|nr:hypothetical protein EF878_18965 [Dickeya undicola]